MGNAWQNDNASSSTHTKLTLGREFVETFQTEIS